MVGGRRPLVEEDLCWKMTFGGRRPTVEDDLQWKTTFDGRWTLVEDTLRWKTTCSGRRPSGEDGLQWKMTFSGRQPLVENDLWWKTTCSGRRPSAEDDLCWILSCCLLPTLLCSIFYVWPASDENIRLAVKGALAYHLQCCTAFKLQNGHQGAPKVMTGSGEGFNTKGKLFGVTFLPYSILFDGTPD